MTGQDIIDRVRLVLDDNAGTGWTLAELATWVNDACLFVALLRPDAVSLNVNMALVGGSRQSIAGLTPPGLRFLDAIYNVTTGRAMRLVDRRRIDAALPAWHASAPGAPVDFAVDGRDPRTFYVWPPAGAGQQINVLYAQEPVKVTVDTLASTTLTPSDVFIDPLTNYVLFRAKSKEAEHAADAAVAAGYRAAAFEALGAKAGADRATSPAANTPSATPTPAGL